MMTKEDVQEKIEDLAEEHPGAIAGVGWLIGLVVAIPITIVSYRYFGKCTGRACAKELVNSGAVLLVK